MDEILLEQKVLPKKAKIIIIIIKLSENKCREKHERVKKIFIKYKLTIKYSPTCEK